MKKIWNFKNRKAFTLIELIVVISVVVVLMSLVIPASQRVLINSRRAKARAQMKQIAETYCRFYQENNYIPNAGNSMDLAEKFAENGELNNAEVYIFPGDPKAATALRDTIYPLDGRAWESGKQLSVCLIGNIATDVNVSTTPIVYSRGLQISGKWSQVDGVWGAEGGFIGFLDGQVRWFTDLAKGGGQLSIATGSTANIETALSGIGTALGSGT
jgi:prepilin-type N-terminal cleavage/methylation domain-containing protein